MTTTYPGCSECITRKCNNCRTATALKLNLIVQCDRCGRHTPVFTEDLERGFTRCDCCLNTIKVDKKVPNEVILKCPNCGKEYKQKFPITILDSNKQNKTVQECECGHFFVKHFYPKN